MPKTSRRENIVSWAERTIRLPSAEARAGSLRLAGYQKGILEAFANPSVRQISVMSPSQCGKTMLLMVMMGYTICNAPRAMMMVSPREDDTKRFLNTKFQPLHDSSPEIRKRVSRPNNRRMGGWSIKRIDFQGGAITFAHSHSPASLRSTTAGVAFADEVDMYSRASEDVDNPIEQIRHRLTTFGARGKLLVISTPTNEGESLIELEYLNGSQGEYETPCVHCGTFGAMDESYIPDMPTDFLVCPHCEGVITEPNRIAMIERGQWVHAYPDNPNLSFHMTQLSSPFARLDMTLARRNGDKRYWSTAVMARPFALPPTQALSVEQAEALVGDCPFDAPTSVTAGVDIQGNRAEITITEWDDTGESVKAHIREHRIFLYGGKTQADFDATIDAILAHLRNTPRLRYVFIDSGYLPAFVLSSIRKAHRKSAYWRKRLRPAKGLAIPNRSTFGMEITAVSKQQIHEGLEQTVIAADEAKSMAFLMAASGALTVQRDGVPADWGRQFSAERIEERALKEGRSRRVWVKIRDRNEALDCFALSLAAYRLYEIERMGAKPIVVRRSKTP